MEKKVKFFQQSLRFDESKLKPEQMHTIVLDFSTKIKLNQGWNLFSEGDPTDSLYLIKKGEIQLQKQVRYLFNESTQLYNYETEQDGPNLNDSLTNPSSKKGKLKNCIIDFIIVSAKEFIGSEDLFYNKKHRTYTAKCLTDVTVYVIQKSQLLKLINEFFLFKVAMQQYAHSKAEHHKERIQTVATAKKINLEQNQQAMTSFKSSSQRDLMITSNSDKATKSYFSRQATINLASFDLPQQSKKSKTIILQSKKSFASPALNSYGQSQSSMKQIQEFSSSTALQQIDQIPSLKLIEENSGQSNHQFHLANGINNPQLNSMKDKRVLLTQPINSDQNDSPAQYLEGLKNAFEGMNFIRHVKTQSDDLTESINMTQSTSNQTSFQNQFWFDQNMKTQLDKKINHSIKEKDPAYIKKVRQTFKGNMESCKFGNLDKKLSKLIQSKPKLISTVMGTLPHVDNQLPLIENDHNEVMTVPPSVTQSRKISDEIILSHRQLSKSPLKQKHQLNQYNHPTGGSSQNIKLPIHLIQQQNMFNKSSSQFFKIKTTSNTPKNNQFSNVYLLNESNIPHGQHDDYQLTGNKFTRNKAPGAKSSSLQLSPVKIFHKEKVAGELPLQKFIQNNQIESSISPKSTKKRHQLSFNINLSSNLVQSERVLNRKSMNVSSQNQVEHKGIFYSPRDSLYLTKNKQNDTKGSVFNSNLTTQRNSVQINRVPSKQSIINYYKNYSISSQKNTFQPNNVEQIS